MVLQSRIDPGAFIAFCFSDLNSGLHRQSEVHTELQRFLSDHPRALIELPRDHGKTFQVCGRVLWELGQEPSLRVRIVCATEAIARERSRFLREQIESNADLRQVFPDLRPGKPWTDTEFTVERPEQLIGPSVAVYGIGGGSTGTRADLLVCDDIVDVRSLASKAERDRTAEYFDNNLMNLLEPDGRFWGLYTPWHGDDINAKLKRRADVFALFRRAIDDDLTPVWPERWPRERLEERRKEIGTASFARGYRLQPVTDEEVPIKPAWVKFWTEPAPCDDIVLSVDPAVSTRAKADRSAIVVLGRVSHPSRRWGEGPGVRGSDGRSPPAPGRGVGQDPAPLSPLGRGAGGEGHAEAPPPVLGVRPEYGVHVLAAWAGRVAAPDLVAKIDALDRLFQPRAILFESNSAFAGIRDLLVRHARFGGKLKGVSQTSDKWSRAAGFSVTVENGCVFLKGGGDGGVDPSQQELYDEMTTFPFADHDDLLDAAMAGCMYLLNYPEPRIW